MKTLLPVIVTMLFHVAVSAQQEVLSVKPGENLNTILPDSVRFVYPQFTAGSVVFRDGTQSNAQLNYNLLSGEIQFIAPKGDTLALMDEATVQRVIIGRDTFFYDKAFIRVIYSTPEGKLAKQERLGFGDVKKGSAYDQYSSTSSITSVSSVRLQDRVTKLNENQAIMLSKRITYYIGDIHNHFLPANKKNLIKLFGKKQQALETYFKNNKVNFEKEAELKALLTVLAG